MANETSERIEQRGYPNGTPANGNGAHANGRAISHYQGLGVDQTADTDTLAQAYGRLRERYHPERNAADPLARDIVRYLDSAYATLVDPERRRVYDASLLNGASTNGHAPTAEGAHGTNGSRNGHASAADAVQVISGHNRTAVAEGAPAPPDAIAEAIPEAGGRGRRGGRRRSAYAERDLTEGSVPKTLWFLAWPQMVSGSMQTLDTIWDLVLAGRG